jgi:hypothetical protein
MIAKSLGRVPRVSCGSRLGGQSAAASRGIESLPDQRLQHLPGEARALAAAALYNAHG